jgi:mono/diheme cytochrome c family protein
MIANQPNKSRFWLIPAVWMGLILMASLPSISAQTAQDYFTTNCSSCHTIGGGPLLGPDLKGLSERQNRDWLVPWILDPLGILGSGDAYALELQRASRGAMMTPSPGINEALANQLLDFIDAQSQLEESLFSGAEADQPLTPEQAAQGRELFTGAHLPQNGAPACIACHTVSSLGGLGGGRLGPDLTQAYGRLGSRQGLIPWMSAVPSPTMRPIFQAHPLEEDEIIALVAFLKEETEKDGPPNQAAVVNFLLFGVAGAVVLLAVFDRIWNRRFTGVRRLLTKGRQI